MILWTSFKQNYSHIKTLIINKNVNKAFNIWYFNKTREKNVILYSLVTYILQCYVSTEESHSNWLNGWTVIACSLPDVFDKSSRNYSILLINAELECMRKCRMHHLLVKTGHRVFYFPLQVAYLYIMLILVQHLIRE